MATITMTESLAEKRNPLLQTPFPTAFPTVENPQQTCASIGKLHCQIGFIFDSPR